MGLASEILAQQPYRGRFDWGRDGVRRAAARSDFAVIVDVLRFSTAAIAAVQHGAVIYPCAPTDDPDAIARCVGAELAAYRPDMFMTHPYSLSPGSYDRVPQGTRIVLPSPNGAACSCYGREVPLLFVGALVNAAAVGVTVSAALARRDASAPGTSHRLISPSGRTARRRKYGQMRAMRTERSAILDPARHIA
jgi:2-phosphosulfolactate phosphatase